MKNRFDLEIEISNTHNFSSHLRDLAYGIMEEQLTQDEIVIVLEGLSALIDIHTEKLYNTLCESYDLNEESYDV